MPKMPRIDIAGMKFGRLAVVSYCGTIGDRRGLWNCVCECGNEYRTEGTKLRSGDTVSCGCKKGEGLPFPDRAAKYKSVNELTGCWEWGGQRDRGGYGRANFSSGTRNSTKFFGVHRLSYEHYVGPINKGLHVLHKCDNRCCFNPEHLFLGTHQDNMNDMHKKGRGPKGYKRKPKPDTAVDSDMKGQP